MVRTSHVNTVSAWRAKSPGASAPKNQQVPQKQFCNKFNKDIAQLVKNLPAMQETWVWPLGQEDALEGMAGIPLQYCCLENPTDRGAWQTTVLGVRRVGRDLKMVHIKNNDNNKDHMERNWHCRRVRKVAVVTSVRRWGEMGPRVQMEGCRLMGIRTWQPEDMPECGYLPYKNHQS